MRRIFNLFRKEVKPIFKDAAHLTILFNKWVSSIENKQGGKRFQFKAHTNKFTIEKWLQIKDEYAF